MITEPLLDPLDLLHLLLLGITCVRQQQLGKVRLTDVPVLVRVLAHELERQDFALQLLLKVEELLDRQLLVILGPKEVGRQGRIHTFKRVARVRVISVSVTDTRLLAD
uniref:Putative secreted peptide n=1 Tax=Anopheles braziliensis TaxID=58242 RepID=A0A2M3ZRD4_9DIPT